ncbi:MAG: aminoacyl-tRNA hydrolase [Leptospiraceae bacterium]|nr:aminoacyl-tRNA hydrolase [Leptospiraceae bacterium]
MSARLMIVGLGNPGNQYSRTRHNAGFLALDRFADQLSLPVSWRAKHDGDMAETELFSTKLILFKPMTYMNRSGGPLQKAMASSGISAAEIIVLHDEVELPFGEVRLKKDGGHKGHNGLRDIMAVLGNGNFIRVRIGVGRPERGEIASYVLGNFSSDEQDGFGVVAEKVVREVENWIQGKRQQ